jgi:hypothetical protein
MTLLFFEPDNFSQMVTDEVRFQDYYTNCVLERMLGKGTVHPHQIFESFCRYIILFLELTHSTALLLVHLH